MSRLTKIIVGPVHALLLATLIQMFGSSLLICVPIAYAIFHYQNATMYYGRVAVASFPYFVNVSGGAEQISTERGSTGNLREVGTIHVRVERTGLATWSSWSINSSYFFSIAWRDVIATHTVDTSDAEVVFNMAYFLDGKQRLPKILGPPPVHLVDKVIQHRIWLIVYSGIIVLGFVLLIDCMSIARNWYWYRSVCCTFCGYARHNGAVCPECGKSLEPEIQLSRLVTFLFRAVGLFDVVKRRMRT